MKRVLSIILATLIVATTFALPASAEGTKNGLFTYELKGNGTAIITDFNWSANGSSDVYIPRMLDGYTVTEIDELAFSDEEASLENKIGRSVVVVLPDTINVIGEKAFYCTEISTIHIPSSVQLIGDGAFAGCSNIGRFSVDEANTTYTTISGILYNKTLKELTAYPLGLDMRLSVPDGITSIAG